jgi:outer membrane protein TolC
MTLSRRLLVQQALLLAVLSLATDRTSPAQSSDIGLAIASPARRVSLAEAIQLAEANEPAFVAASAESRALALERTDAKAALLPSVTYRNQVIYTQPNGNSSRIGQVTGEPSPVFIANNAIREYASQGVATEKLGFQELSAIRLADANAARANAEAEVARRGLVASVVNLYYTVSSTQTKIAVAQRALDEANRFVTMTQQRENAREAAHADVIKAQLQQKQRDRELSDAQLAVEKARLELAVLLFSNPDTPFTVDEPGLPSALPDRGAIEAAAQHNNPELRSALASLQVSEANTYAARADLLPELGLNATYGIDAPQVAVNGPNGVRNLGYSGSVSLDIPVWDWLTAERKLKESRIRRDATKVLLTSTQRRLLADLDEFYAEATAAQKQLASLDSSVQDARESLRLTNLRYTNGESTVLEVVDAEDTLTSTETAQADAMVRYQTALAQLQTLSGSF